MNSLTSVLIRGALNKPFKCRFAPNMVRLQCLQYYTLRNTSKKFDKIENLGSRPLSKSSTYFGKLSEYIYIPRGNRIDRLKKFFYRLLLLHRGDQIASGLHCYNTLSKLNYNEFFNMLNMPDTFYSWFKVTELHVWILLIRLSDLKQEGMITRKYLVEGMWIDTEARAKKIEPLNKDFSKNMSVLNDKFKIALLSYDEGFLKSDKVLANAVWYQFFDKNCDDPRLLEALVSYIRFQVKFLDSLGLNVLTKEYNEKRIWTPLKPHIERTN